MRPEFNSRRLFGITRSKGKMYELGLPESLHLAVPPGSEPQELFLLTVGTLGDAAAILSDAEAVEDPLPSATVEELNFAASFFDAFLESRFSEPLARDTALLAASSYYIARRPGSSLLLARQHVPVPEASPVERLLHWALLARWTEYPDGADRFFGEALRKVAQLLVTHFHDGSGLMELGATLKALRRRAYAGASARDLLFIDIVAAIVRMRTASSVWATLPGFTGLSMEQWAPAIRRPEFPKELWPSQMLLGRAGVFSGASGIIQMPTSAGKTRSVEIVLRSSFLAGRTKLAVVLAPFRALCHEIGVSLRHAFRDDDVKVNELTDVMQLDFLQRVAELLGSEGPTSNFILVLTPEKLLYLLRQTPALTNDIGVVVYDEGHQFDSGSRGITYELLLTEIKALLPKNAQTLLVSAVIQNAPAIGEWLIGDGSQVVGGTDLLPTSRSVAFASWLERLGQLMFFETGDYAQRDYFVPRVLERHTLKRRPGERVDRVFPMRDRSNDVALYLGIRLAPSGSVAIFCGQKNTAASIAARAVDVYDRGFNLATPAASADPEELRRMKALVDGHFGEQSIISRAASLGIFVHHGTTPHGLRLAVEHGMQQGSLNFVACTSTLAQGVNLPIRYLIVSGIYQGTERIKVRDFQNLIGRAGRSGMHTEGLVIFADPTAYDRRRDRRESWKFKASVELLSTDRSGSTSSSLLELLAPFSSDDGTGALQIAADSLCDLILSGEEAWLQWANDVASSSQNARFRSDALIDELRRRRQLMSAVESYLMANRGTISFEEFKSAAKTLATSTLAHHLASDELKLGVLALFASVADYIEHQEPIVEKQAVYAKTLLGVVSAKTVENWVMENRGELLSLSSNEDWLARIWELFAGQSDDRFFHAVKPKGLPLKLATMWLRGEPYSSLFAESSEEGGSKPFGKFRRRRLTDDDIVAFCEGTLGFECSLILAAVTQFLYGGSFVSAGNSDELGLFQKSLKYGLPDWLTVSCYEAGFADRVVAQRLCDDIRADGFVGTYFEAALVPHRDRVVATLADYPSYFMSVVDSRQ